eukprot:18438-Heterococcus_DN1.PRE.1
MAILVADCFTSPLLRLINPAGLFKRYVLLKRARTQAAANALMEGTIWNIVVTLVECQSLTSDCGVQYAALADITAYADTYTMRTSHCRRALH